MSAIDAMSISVYNAHLAVVTTRGNNPETKVTTDLFVGYLGQCGLCFHFLFVSHLQASCLVREQLHIPDFGNLVV